RETTRQLQRGYVYFQDFIPGSDFDIRLNVIGDRCFGLRRMVRSGDFRASGSGSLDYDPNKIPRECVAMAMDVAKRARLQSVAFDFIPCGNSHRIIEISYAFPRGFYDPCPGYWDGSLEWHEAPVTPQYFMVQDLLQRIDSQRIAYWSRVAIWPSSFPRCAVAG